MPEPRVSLTGSRREPPSASRLGPASPLESVAVTVHLRSARRRVAARLSALARQAPGARVYVDRASYAEEYGAAPDDLEAVRDFAREHGLFVLAEDRAAGTVRLRGTVARMETAFGTELSLHQSETGVFRGRSGTLTLPEGLARRVVAVLGLDDRQAARTHFRVGEVRPGEFRPALASAASFTPPQVAALYDFPTTATGQGQCVALIELGGGTRKADLTTYFTRLGIPLPTVVSVGVDGATDSPTGEVDGPDGEVMLDVEVAGSVAPGATIAVYFAPNTDAGFADAVLAAVHDTTHRPTVISISWGQAEDQWTAAARAAMNQAFQAAALLGISVYAAAGDNGSGDNVSDGSAHVDFPAASPFVVGCGGTALTSAGGAITAETVWSSASGGATGGGVSAATAVPAYQRDINPTSANAGHKPGRGVPDVSGNADPATGYQVLVDGTSAVFGGTSAVAPLWAGLTALLQQQVGHALAPLPAGLYAAADALRDITEGSNGAYDAGPGWDACTGLGSPDGAALATALANAPGAPST